MNNHKPLISLSTGAVKYCDFNKVCENFSINKIKDISMNLSLIIEKQIDYLSILNTLKNFNLKTSLLEGGWCDFFLKDEKLKQTIKSVFFQTQLCQKMNVNRLRLFWGREKNFATATKNISSLIEVINNIATNNKNIEFVFENHGGVSNDAYFIRNVLVELNLPNIGVNFDTVNYEIDDQDPFKAYDLLLPYIKHIHVKGKLGKSYVEYGEGDSLIDHIIKRYLNENENPSIGIEYEGNKDKLSTLISSYKLFEKKYNNGFFQ